MNKDLIISTLLRANDRKNIGDKYNLYFYDIKIDICGNIFIRRAITSPPNYPSFALFLPAQLIDFEEDFLECNTLQDFIDIKNNDIFHNFMIIDNIQIPDFLLSLLKDYINIYDSYKGYDNLLHVNHLDYFVLQIIYLKKKIKANDHKNLYIKKLEIDNENNHLYITSLQTYIKNLEMNNKIKNLELSFFHKKNRINSIILLMIIAVNTAVIIIYFIAN